MYLNLNHLVKEEHLMSKTMYGIFSDQAYDDFMSGKAVDNIV